MNVDLGSHLQEGLLGLLGTIIVGLLAWRGTNKVKTDNADANRESTFQDNLQKRYDAAVQQIDHLRTELAEAKEGRSVLQRRLLDRDRTIRNLLDSLDAEQQKNARRWAPESAFAPPNDFIDPKPKDR